jgi:hypothetical protein
MHGISEIAILINSTHFINDDRMPVRIAPLDSRHMIATCPLSEAQFCNKIEFLSFLAHHGRPSKSSQSDQSPLSKPELRSASLPVSEVSHHRWDTSRCARGKRLLQNEINNQDRPIPARCRSEIGALD